MKVYELKQKIAGLPENVDIEVYVHGKGHLQITAVSLQEFDNTSDYDFVELVAENYR